MSAKRRQREAAVPKPLEIPLVHERYDWRHPLLRELVSVTVFGSDNLMFDVLLTRVPSVGEEIEHGAKQYKVLHVTHVETDDDGRTCCGSHAHVMAELLPPDTRSYKKYRLETLAKKPKRGRPKR